MDILLKDLDNLNRDIEDLETKIQKEKIQAEDNIKPLNQELSQIKEDKRHFALKNDFDSVQACIRKENNLKFKINAQWNKHSMLNNDLSKLKSKKSDLEYQIKLKEDKIKRNNELLAQMNNVLGNYKITQNLKQAAVDANIHPDSAEQWFEWGKNNFSDTYVYFYDEIIKIDNRIKDLKSQKLKDQMDSVIEAYKKTNSLKEASKIANVSYDTVQYWYEWGSRGFGEENTYFFKQIRRLKS